MPRLRTTPNGFNEWLICEAIDWARDNGFERVSLNFAPFAALLAPEAELTRPSGAAAARAADAQGPLPARQPARVQPQVLPALGAALRRLRAPARPAESRDRRARRRGVPPVPERAHGDASARGSCSRCLGVRAQLGLARPARRGGRAAAALGCAAAPLAASALRRTARGSAASSSGLGGWAFYVAALALAPLSLVQATSAGGIGMLAALAHRRGVRSPRQWLAVSSRWPAWGCSRCRSPAARRRAPRPSVRWSRRLAASAILAASSAAAPALAGGALGLAAGLSTRRATSATKAAVHGGAWLALRAGRARSHGLAFVALQLGFQRGTRSRPPVPRRC